MSNKNITFIDDKDYKKIILEKLLKKYNSRIAKGIKTTRRILLKPTELYKNYADNNADIIKKQNLNEAVNILIQNKMIDADYLKFSTDIEKIYLCEEKIDSIYEYLREQYGIIPQSTIIMQLRKKIEKYNHGKTLVKKYCENILSYIQNPRSKLDLEDMEKIEKNLKMLHFLEKNEVNLYMREASMLVYGDSKLFEKNNYDEVCNIVKEILCISNEGYVQNEAVLSQYHIMQTEQEIFLKGNWKIEWDDYILDISKLQGGIAISSRDIHTIKKITVLSSYMMTIENKTSFQRVDSRADGEIDAKIDKEYMATMYLGGFANRHQIYFLIKVIQDNPNIEYRHFGDIDIGGFLIHRHLCHETSQNFLLYKMGIEELRDERFKHCLKQLTDYDKKRMEILLKDEIYRPVLMYMKEYNVKLEQEIVSYYFNAPS